MASKFKLSPQQNAVLDWAHDTDPNRRHLNLIARAGCGKTSTIVELVEDIMKSQPKGRFSIFVGAYNKSIAVEIKNIFKRLGFDWKTVQAGTIHSAGFSVWRYRNKNVKVEGGKMRDVIRSMDTSKRETWKPFLQFTEGLTSLAKGNAFGAPGMPEINDKSAWFNLMEHHGVDSYLDDGVSVDAAIDFSISAYQRSLEWCSTLIDFDDMILAPLVFNIKPWQHDWVAMDEAQDTNPARRALAFKMLKPKGRFMAVGDDCQAIYGFTGADSDAMDLIADQLGSVTLPLNKTFRCPKAVVELAQQWVPDIEAADTNPDGIVREIPIGEPDGSGESFWDEELTHEDVILCRNTAPLIDMAYALIKRGQPCKVEGRDIGESILTLIRRWKTVKTIDQLVDRVETFKVEQVARLLKKEREAAAQAIEDRCDTILVLCERMQEEGKTKLTDLVSFIEGLFQTSKVGDDQKLLTLSTIHKSKGREWSRVYLLGRDKFQPSPYAKKEWETQQEINLMYVAVTRAQEEFIDVIMD